MMVNGYGWLGRDGSRGIAVQWRELIRNDGAEGRAVTSVCGISALI